MSDLNDDLLNYEIGDVDDNDLIGADEDELLLSDDESIPVKISQELEANLLGEEYVETGNGNHQRTERSEDTSASQTETESGNETPNVVHKIEKPSNVTPKQIPQQPKTSPSTRATTRRSAAAAAAASIASAAATATATATASASASAATASAAAAAASAAAAAAATTQTTTTKTKTTATIKTTATTKTTTAAVVNRQKPKVVAEVQVKNSKKQEVPVDVHAPVAVIPSSSHEESMLPSSDEVKSCIESDVESNITSKTDKDKDSEISIIAASVGTQSSQITSDDTNFDNELNYDELDADESDDGNERRNPKTCVERAVDHPSSSDSDKAPGPLNRPPRHGGHFPNQRGRFPAPFHTYRPPSNENFNPQFHQQFRGPNHMIGGRPMLPPAPFDGRPMNPYHRMPMRGGMPLGQRLPLPPAQLGHPPHPSQLHHQPPGTGPPFPIFNSGPNAPPRQIPPRPGQFGNMPPHRFPPGPNFPPINRHPMMHRAPQMPPQPAMINSAAGPTPIAPPQMPPISRKVLINPNFKGGVEAATNQLMKDTMGGAHFMAANSDAELSRIQEAFINQNRAHIERRRRSRDRSMERERERSYSPPSRRRAYDRDNRKPYNNYRGDDNRGRRGDSRENDNLRRNAGRRRSGSFERSTDRYKKNEPEEDEETRAYRLEIEKQKAMREKILRDKETRRRKAVEEIKQKDEDKKVVVDEPAQKLTPIIVTTKKIISLKKKSNEQSAQSSVDSGHSPEKSTRHLTSGRKIPMATIHPETKRSHEIAPTATTAIVKPVLKQMPSNCLPHQSNDLDDYDEDELLADSPTESPVHGSKMNSNPSRSNVSGGGLLSNRRIIVRNTSPDEPVGGKKLILSKTRTNSNDNNKTKSIDVDEIKNIVQSTATSTHNKGIFDRLDKKLVGVNDATKRKLQRIVINNSE